MTWSKGATTLNTTITLDEGNYNINNLLSQLSAQIVSKIYQLTGITPNLNFTYTKTTGKCNLTIVGTDSTSTSLTLNFGNNVQLGEFFGFVQNATLSYNNSNISTPAISTQNVNVNQINYICIRSSTLIQRECYENVVEKDVYSDILAKVLVNVTPGSYILYDNGNLSCDVANKVIDQINIYLSDNLSYDLSLYGLEWNLTLIIQEIGTNKSDRLLMMESQPEIPVQKNKDELLSQIEELKKQLNAIDEEQKSMDK